MILQFIKFRIYNSTHFRILLGVKLMIHFSYTWWFTNDMSTTHCGANIVRIRVGLSNDILRFDYALRPFLFFVTYYYGLTAQRLISKPKFEISDFDFSKGAWFLMFYKWIISKPKFEIDVFKSSKSRVSTSGKVPGFWCFINEYLKQMPFYNILRKKFTDFGNLKKCVLALRKMFSFSMDILLKFTFKRW